MDLRFSFLAGPADWRTLRVHFVASKIAPTTHFACFPKSPKFGRGRHSINRGYPSLYLPLDLDAKSSQLVEIRLDIASSKFRAPAQASSATAESPVDSTLADLDGFELINPNKGLRLVFPPGW